MLGPDEMNEYYDVIDNHMKKTPKKESWGDIKVNEQPCMFDNIKFGEVTGLACPCPKCSAH